MLHEPPNNYGTYYHIKTGRRYMITGYPLVKVSGYWVQGVEYMSATDGTGQKYVRTKKDFMAKFDTWRL